MFSGWKSKKYQLLKRIKLLCRLRAGGLGLLLLLQVVTSTRSGTWRWSPARLQVAARPFALPLPSFSAGVLCYASGSLTPSATFRSSATRVHEGISGKPSFFPGSLMLAQCRLLLGVFFHFDRQLFGLSPCGAAVGQAVRQLTLKVQPWMSQSIEACSVDSWACTSHNLYFVSCSWFFRIGISPPEQKNFTVSSGTPWSRRTSSRQGPRNADEGVLWDGCVCKWAL